MNTHKHLRIFLLAACWIITAIPLFANIKEQKSLQELKDCDVIMVCKVPFVKDFNTRFIDLKITQTLKGETELKKYRFPSRAIETSIGLQYYLVGISYNDNGEDIKSVYTNVDDETMLTFIKILFDELDKHEIHVDEPI